MNLRLHRKKSFQANDLIHDQFIVLGKLDNKKHSSTILKGFDKIAHNFVVIKITSAAYKEKNKAVTKILQKLRGGTGVPNIIWRGLEGPNTITVTECLGPNLKKLFFMMDKSFSVATICSIGIQVLNTLEYIHSHDYVCCNVMPKEILISLHKKSQTLFITDYKQAKKVKSSKMMNGDQGGAGVNKAILNKFSSVNLHLGLPPSNKDDIESLAYILVYFFKKGNLYDKTPKFSTKEEKIKFYEQQKLAIVPETFCKGFPQEICQFMTYIKSMQTNQHHEKIDYDFIRKLLRNLFNKHSSMENFHYDWMSKAIIYNMDPNGPRKIDSDKQSDNASIKSEIISFQSSKGAAAESEIFSEENTTRRNSSAANSPYASQTKLGSPFFEYDFLDVDESLSATSKSEPNLVKRVESFEEKIKSFQYVKKRNSAEAKLKIEVGSNTTRENSDELHSARLELTTGFSNTLEDQSSGRPKIKSVTEVTKLSKFGKSYQNNKAFKSK